MFSQRASGQKRNNGRQEVEKKQKKKKYILISLARARSRRVRPPSTFAQSRPTVQWLQPAFAPLPPGAGGFAHAHDRGIHGPRPPRARQGRRGLSHLSCAPPSPPPPSVRIAPRRTAAHTHRRRQQCAFLCLYIHRMTTLHRRGAQQRINNGIIEVFFNTKYYNIHLYNTSTRVGFWNFFENYHRYIRPEVFFLFIRRKCFENDFERVRNTSPSSLHVYTSLSIRYRLWRLFLRDNTCTVTTLQKHDPRKPFRDVRLARVVHQEHEGNFSVVFHFIFHIIYIIIKYL